MADMENDFLAAGGHGWKTPFRRVDTGGPPLMGRNSGPLGFLDRTNKPHAAGQLLKRYRSAQAEVMDPLVAADQRQQGNDGVGEPSWQGHGGSRENVCVAGESAGRFAILHLTQMQAGM